MTLSQEIGTECINIRRCIRDAARARFVLGLVLLASGWSHLARADSEPTAPAVRSGSDAEVPPDWLGQVKGTVQAMEYAFSAAGGGDFSAPNRAHNLRSRVTGRGVEITQRTGDSDFRLGLRLTGLGREDAVRDVPAGTPRINGSRVEIVRSGLPVTEWYLNDANGLEQGFTLERRPASGGAARTLVLRMAVEGTLSARPMEDARGVMFSDGAAKPIVRYAGLKVVDALGAELPAQLVAAEGGLEIRVDDRDAAYPIVVDPIATTPIWTAEINQNDAEFGFSVATAGDVNGDGYSDVIVGAEEYDNTFTGEGAAFLYLGSASGMASTTPVWAGYGGQSVASYGISVASAGDVNGDGYSDVIVGAFLFDLVVGQLTITDMGAAFVYHGSSNNPPLGGPAWTKLGPDGGAYFGRSVATAGDVNGDGFGDVIVGANRVGHSTTINTGGAYIYLGSGSGLGGTETWTGTPDATSAQYGRSVATAGDVNGDGYGDVIVGAPGFLLGPYDDGKTFVYHGSGTGVSTTPNRTITGDAGSAGFLGETVATAGDLNGDGYGDVVVSARNYANGQPFEGRIYVYYGSSSGVGFVPDIREGNQDYAYFGTSVATAGDVNGDGYADLVVGIGVNQAGTGGGRAVAYFGSALGLSSGPGWSVETSSPADLFGYSVATAGDVNGDGYNDIIVGAARADNGHNNEGQAHIYLGSSQGPSGIVSNWTVSGVNTYDFMGWSVASAGDVNGDGYSDVIVGMPLYDGGEDDEGRVFVYHGSANGLSTSPNWWFESESPGAGLGISVAGAGDINNDGFGDIVAGAHVIDGTFVDGGGAFVWHGSQFGLPFALPNWSAFGASTNAQFGSSVASAGDVNGDGHGDVVVGAPLDENGQSDEGRAFAYLGSSGGLGTSAAWIVEGDQVDAHLGNSVGSAGDVNGDGFSDVVVGAELYDVPGAPLMMQDAGRVLVYYGGGGTVGLSTSPAKTLNGTQDGAQFGHVVGRAGDVNGDAYSDVFVCEQLYDDPEPDEGRVSVYHGSAGGLPSAPNWFVTSNQAFSDFGSSAASAGDVNADGYSDLIVAAVFYEGSGADDGRIFVYLGSASGLNANAAWYRDGIQDYANMGGVAGAGDVDGDGFGDVLAGAPGYTVASSFAAGQAYMFYGNPNNGPGAGLPRQLNQFQYCPSICIVEPISPLGLSDYTNFHVGTLARSAAGRERLKVQWEVKPRGTPFNGTGVQSGTSFVTDPPTSGGSHRYLQELASCPAAQSPCQWRLRVASNNPYFPRSPWLSIPANGPGEWDLRTTRGVVAVGDEPQRQIDGIELGSSFPSPARAGASIRYALERAGRVRLTLHDVAGRTIRTLVNGWAEQGPHVASWDGNDEVGNASPAGIYFYRLEALGSTLSRQLVLVP